jgi:hypothetical protein
MRGEFNGIPHGLASLCCSVLRFPTRQFRTYYTVNRVRTLYSLSYRNIIDFLSDEYPMDQF